MDVSTDDELLMYDKLHGTNICVEPMNFDYLDVVLVSEFDFMERRERRRMGGPTSPSCVLSPSENASTETSSDSFYERVKRPRYPCVGQTWYVKPWRHPGFFFSSLSDTYRNTRRPHFPIPKPESRKRHRATFGRYYSSEEETETEIPRSDTSHRTRTGYRKHRRAVPEQNTSEDVNIIIDLYLNIDPELQAKVSYGKQKSGDCVLGNFIKSPVDVSAPEPEAQRVGLAVGLAAGMVFRRFR
ncbi:hypothetical protein TRV_06907 [Trichophyton verrucosum HKI 0517]|uniref:Uncharacterized protein n=1 Tax=Trichophyton verrucosum (strain HKI 0517) TaxID=663202 RepID=D4DI99_TRIVH|nr:uncharacterized protein TRV_06907 [Trichophyton verrucosum HKI 0517]EFE38437.1 hypothetical protein TRV_06907 [Trichophyton verrucosum HKI 0517]